MEVKGPRIGAVLNYPNALLLLLYLTVGVAVVPYLCRRLPFSIFYTTSQARDREAITTENDKLVKEAFSSMNAMNASGKLSLLKRSVQEPEFCFVVNSVSRHVNIYSLTQVVNALIPQIVADQQSVFAVYNAEGKTHKEAEDLSQIFPVVTNPKPPASATVTSYDKQRTDYIFASEWCLQSNANYVIILEDDALPSSNFIEHLRFILDYRVNKRSEQWAVLKLFYPEKYQGWANDLNVVVELVVCSGLGGLILTVILSCGRLREFKNLCKWKSFTPVGFRFILSTAFATYLLLSVGRPHFIAVRKMSMHLTSVVQAPGCCCPANLYPKSHLQELVQYLREIRCDRSLPIDLAIDKFVEDRGYKKLLVVPNMVKHIGFISSLPGKNWKPAKNFRIK